MVTSSWWATEAAAVMETRAPPRPPQGQLPARQRSEGRRRAGGLTDRQIADRGCTRRDDPEELKTLRARGRDQHGRVSRHRESCRGRHAGRPDESGSAGRD